ncbi:LSU ribosomal protein L7AE [Giardia duodenalis assemblage B]|uniref:60S ribosomal protein L7a n=2 Tax=Giardia intestinalis TaxID=5741 RepID=A0A132NTZ9_GIAIN|nr:LSU ribosomal protein L7AE [Giardia intestinalis]KWX13152.1 LSU ribosomal protein L7AE [Giardia intestinalis assemblage B]
MSKVSGSDIKRALAVPENQRRSKCDFDLTPFVRWPRQVRVQRQKAVLQRRLKVPPTVNQFMNPISRNLTNEIFNLARKYSPESKEEHKARLLQIADAKANGKPLPEKSNKLVIASGIRRITSLVESKRAKLVLIANDVDPLEVCSYARGAIR